MTERQDILFDSNNVLVVEDSDLKFGLSDNQHIQDTINAAPGWWKENFSDGVNISSFINSSGKQQVLSRLIKIQLTSDLYNVTNPLVKYSTDGKLVINPNATI